jgi:hypothetical protein
MELAAVGACRWPCLLGLSMLKAFITNHLARLAWLARLNSPSTVRRAGATGVGTLSERFN